jgi:hypothetical protein
LPQLTYQTPNNRFHQNLLSTFRDKTWGSTGMTSLLCIHYNSFEESTHKNLARFARLKVVQLYKTCIQTGQSWQLARFWQFFKLIINFYKQPALWFIIILLALTAKILINNLCNWLISYNFIIQYSDLSSIPRTITIDDQIYNIHFAYQLQYLLKPVYEQKRKTFTLVSYLFQRKTC